MMALPVGTASVERSFSQMKLIKTCLRSHLSDSNLEHLMKIAIKGPQLTDVDFDGISIFLNRKIDVFHFNLVTYCCCCYVFTVEISFWL